MKSLEKTSSLLKCLFLALIFIGQNFAYSQCDLIITSPSPTQVCPGTVVNLNAVATVYGANQSFNFNSGSLPSGWSVSGGPTFGTPCGAGPGGDYYWASTAVGTPNITTAGIDICSGGNIVFDMAYAVQGGAIPCEGPDEPDEGVSIEYSIDGGATWIEFIYYHPNGTVLGANPGGNAPTVAGATPFTDWSTISVAIPPGAISANTMFRWVQTNSSGTCCDNWGIDNVYINAGPCLSANVNWSNGQNGVNNISPTINGAECFTADVYDDFGNYLCSSPTTFCFSVFIPSIDAGSDVTLCNGGSTTLTASGGSGFTWDNGVTNGVPFVPPLGTTTYTVSGTDVNGCAATDQVVLTVTPVTPPTINPAGPACIINGLLALSGTPAGGTFSGIGVTGTNFNPATAGAGTHTVTYTYTSGGCTGSATTNIVVNPLPVVSINAQANLCANSSAAGLVGNPAGGTFSGPGMTGSSFNPATAGVGTHTFTYTYTDGNGCTNNATTNITVTPLNTITAGTNQTVCINSVIANITLATTAATGATFTGLPAGVLGTWAGNVATISGTPTVAGTFNYTVTTTGGCPPATSTGTITVTPLNTIAAGTNQTVCINSAIANITLATTGAAGVTFAGLPAGVTGSWAGNVVTISGTPTVSGTFNYTVTTTGGCSLETTTGTITVNPLTVPTFIPTPSLCQGTVPPIPPPTSINNVAGIWSPSSISTTTPGTFTYTFTPNDLDCNVPVQVNVTIDPLPTVDAGTYASVCEDASLTTLAGSPVGGTFSGTGVAGNSFSPSQGTQTITYTYTDINGCTNTDNQQITIFNLPVVNAGNDLTICEGQSVTLSGSGASNYNWTNGVLNNQGFTPGLGTSVYTITGTDANGCVGTDDITVTVIEIPVAEAIPDVTTGFPGLSVNFLNNSSITPNYLWNFGDGATGVTTNVGTSMSNTYDEPGTYFMVLTASNGTCTDYDTVQIIVIEYPDPIIEVPNVFTPNNDGSNEFFFINTEYTKSIQYIIVNRWGNLIFEDEGVNPLWNGNTANEKPVDEGVYFVKYVVIGLNNETYSGHGSVTLIRD
jgi:gliding motility-associated-like protein